MFFKFFLFFVTLAEGAIAEMLSCFSFCVANKLLTSLTSSSELPRCSYSREVLIADGVLEAFKASGTSSHSMIKVQKSPLEMVLQLPKSSYCGQRIR